MLKVSQQNASAPLRFFRGEAMVKVLAEAPGALLLERLLPHPSLLEWVAGDNDDQASDALCEVIERLHACTGRPEGFQPLVTRWLAMREHMADGRVSAVRMPLYELACRVDWELPLAPQAPLHGDLHHGHVLRSAERGWVAIDPKGLLGPRIYDYATTLCNPHQQPAVVADPARMQRQATRLAERAGLDATELLRFAFVHAAQCGAWITDPGCQAGWEACARTAARLAGLSLPD